MQMQRPSSVVWQLDGYPDITGQHLVPRNPGGTRDAKNGPGRCSSPIRKFLILRREFGAGEGIRTLDPNLGKREVGGERHRSRFRVWRRICPAARERLFAAATLHAAR